MTFIGNPGAVGHECEVILWKARKCIGSLEGRPLLMIRFAATYFTIYMSPNLFVSRYIKQIEMTGVLMRITSFSLVSWMGPESPFMYVWIFNTIDAIMLTWCSTIKRDMAYTLLNGFWILVGIVGVARAAEFIH